MRFNLIDEIKNNKALYTVLGLYILFLIPMIVICFYVIPSADDLAHRGDFVELLGANYTFTEYINAVIKLSNIVYFETQGQYVINYLIYLNPSMISLSFAPIPCILNLLFFLFATGILSKYFTKYILKADYKVAMWIWMILSLLLMQFVTPSELFYWYAGFIAYTFPFALTMVVIALFIKVYNEQLKRNGLIVLLAIIGFIIGGMHYPLLLFVLCLTVLTMFLLLLLKKHEVLYFVPFLILLLIGTVISFISPGNATRLGFDYSSGLHPIKAIYVSVEKSIYELVDVIIKTPILLLFTLLTLLIVFYFIRMKFSFKYPGVVTSMAFLLCATVYVPQYYVIGIGELAPRYSGLAHYISIILLLIVLMYWLGWFLKKYNIGKIEKNSKTVIIASLAICLALSVTLVSQAYSYSVMQMNTFKAADDLIHGKVVRYNAEVNEIFNMLRSAETEEVTIPATLTDTNTMHKMVLEPKTWELRSLGRNFGKDAIPDPNMMFPWEEDAK